MTTENFTGLMPAVFKSPKQRFLVAALLGIFLYTVLFFINVGFNIVYTIEVLYSSLFETSLITLFFFCELELIYKLDQHFNRAFGGHGPKLRKNLLEYSLFLVISLVLLTLIFIVPVLLGLGVRGVADLTDILWLKLRQVYGLSAVFLSLLYLIKITYFNYLHLKQMVIDTERLQKERVQQQFETLKNYINPDFLFCSLDTLTTLVPQDKDKAAQYIHQLSGVYRYILENKDKELVTLRREADFMQGYAFLLRLQYGTALELTYEIKEDSRDWCLPPLTLQFIVENLMRHLTPTPENALCLHILGTGNQLLIRYRLQQHQTTPAPFKNSLVKIMQKYEYLTDRKIITQHLGEEIQVSVPLLKVSHEPRPIITN